MIDFSQDEQNEIIEMYKNNVGVEDIIDIFKSDEQHIRKVLKAFEIDRQYNKFSQELYSRIIELYQRNYTQDKICESLLITRTGLINTLNRNGIPRRTSSECNRRYSRNQNYFDQIDTPNKAYILGMLYADGNNHLKHNSITLTLQESDKELLLAVKEELKYNGPLRFIPLHDKNPNYQNQYCLCINDEYMSQKLAELGVVNAKSLVLEFPSFLDPNLLSHFIRGYFDGDGNIYYDKKRNKCQTQTVGTVNFCNALSNILFGFECKNNIKHPRQCKENTVIIQTSGNKSSYQFLSWMYDNADRSKVR